MLKRKCKIKDSEKDMTNVKKKM